MHKTKQLLLINKHLLAISAVFILGTILRFYNLNWDLGQYLHPDERLYINAANLAFPHSLSEFLSPSSPLNPHMFYYGSFPLYLYKIVASVLFKEFDILIISRLISALFSSCTIIFIYLLTKQFFSEKVAIVSAVIFAFAPGSIQYAHFNTTESLLLFLLTVITYVSSKMYLEKRPELSVYLGILLGLSFATKIVGLSFIMFPLLSFLLLFIKEKTQRMKLLIFFFIFVGIAILTGFSMSPYQIIDWNSFSKEQSYMQGVTYGKSKPPFVIIYENTPAYIYPVLTVLPYTFGLISFICSLIGIFLLTKQKHKREALLFLLLFPCIYFLWAGAWFAKFARYYLLLIPFLSIFAGVCIIKMRPALRGIVLFLIILQGLFFFKIYLLPNTRIAATYWIGQEIPKHSTIATEHWDDALPLRLFDISQYPTVSLPVYDSDTEQKVDQLAQTVATSDYIILSSRRVYISILQNEKIYPYTSQFYTQLFAGNLGYVKVKEFTNYPYLFSDDLADESFQSYDHPPVTIFRNEKKFTKNEIKERINYE